MGLPQDVVESVLCSDGTGLFAEVMIVNTVLVNYRYGGQRTR